MAATSNLLRDRREAQTKVVNGQQVFGARQWEKPKAGWLKVNMDATVFQDKSIGCGAVIRNDQGLFLAARSQKMHGVWSAKEAEALALQDALASLRELQYTHCRVETDSKIAVQACAREPD